MTAAPGSTGRPDIERELYPSLEVMLAPESLRAITGRPVHDVCTLSFHWVDSLSGSRLLRVEAGPVPGQHFIVKRIARGWDCVMHATDDHRCGRVTGPGHLAMASPALSRGRR